MILEPNKIKSSIYYNKPVKKMYHNNKLIWEKQGVRIYWNLLVTGAKQGSINLTLNSNNCYENIKSTSIINFLFNGNYNHNNVTLGHKYLFRAYVKILDTGTIDKFYWYPCNTHQMNEFINAHLYPEGLYVEKIVTCNYPRLSYIQVKNSDNANISDWSAEFSLYVHDLTNMFGRGNEPSTPEEFHKIIDKNVSDINAYNAGLYIII